MYHELADIIFEKDEKIQEPNKDPYDHEYGNRIALINEEFRIKANRILYTNRIEYDKSML